MSVFMQDAEEYVDEMGLPEEQKHTLLSQFRTKEAEGILARAEALERRASSNQASTHFFYLLYICLLSWKHSTFLNCDSNQTFILSMYSYLSNYISLATASNNNDGIHLI